MEGKSATKINEFSLTLPVWLFPSDNVIEAGRLKDRFALKARIRNEAAYQIKHWLKVGNIKKFSAPLFKCPVAINIAAFYKDRRRRDIHNLSAKVFIDALVLASIILDDDINHVPVITLAFGGYVDKTSYVTFTMTACGHPFPGVAEIAPANLKQEKGLEPFYKD